MRTTIKDIAADTGLSVTTVSLVLNHKAGKIPQITQDLVFRSAKELGYRPNQLAVSLVKKRTQTIGLIISDVRNMFFATLAKGVEDECRRHGWNMILCNTNDLHQRDLDYINMLADKGVDGIVYGMSRDTTLEKAKECCGLLDNLHLPFVMIDRYFESLDYPSVVVDHRHGGYLATRHLLEQGHQRIACVTGPLHLTDSVDRLIGYRKALEEIGLPYVPELIWEGEYSTESGIEAMDYLQGKDFSAVFAFNDMTAYGVYSRAKEYHYAIPENFALMGYDDIFFSKILEVPLTSVHQPIYEMGEEATRRLLDLIDGKTLDRKYVAFEPTLVVRKSTSVRELSIQH